MRKLALLATWAYISGCKTPPTTALDIPKPTATRQASDPVCDTDQLTCFYRALQLTYKKKNETPPAHAGTPAFPTIQTMELTTDCFFLKYDSPNQFTTTVDPSSLYQSISKRNMKNLIGGAAGVNFAYVYQGYRGIDHEDRNPDTLIITSLPITEQDAKNAVKAAKKLNDHLWTTCENPMSKEEELISHFKQDQSKTPGELTDSHLKQIDKEILRLKDKIDRMGPRPGTVKLLQRLETHQAVDNSYYMSMRPRMDGMVILENTGHP